MKAKLTGLMLGLCSMSLYACSSSSSSRSASELVDASWVKAAGEICDAAQAELQALPPSQNTGFIENPTPEQIAQRADLVGSTNDILDAMVADLTAIPISDDADTAAIGAFTANWSLVVGDRRRYENSLRSGIVEPYTESVVDGAPVSNAVMEFAEGETGNNIPQCSPPRELAGSG